MKFLSFDAYALKLIAVVGMIANHVAIGLAPVLPMWLTLVLYSLGGLTYVIMAYFVVEGYKHTSNLKKYIGRLLIFGLLAIPGHHIVLGSTSLMGGPIFLNIMFTIILSLIMLKLYDTIKIRALFWLVFVIFCGVAMFMDLFFMGMVVPVLYYAIKKESRRRTVPGVVSGIVWGIFGILTVMSIWALQAFDPYAATEMLAEMGMHENMIFAMPSFAIGAFAGAILVRNFNGERGKRSKWLFYVMYPVHLSVIAIIMFLLGLV